MNRNTQNNNRPIGSERSTRPQRPTGARPEQNVRPQRPLRPMTNAPRPRPDAPQKELRRPIKDGNAPIRDAKAQAPKKPLDKRAARKQAHPEPPVRRRNEESYVFSRSLSETRDRILTERRERLEDAKVFRREDVNEKLKYAKDL